MKLIPPKKPFCAASIPLKILRTSLPVVYDDVQDTIEYDTVVRYCEKFAHDSSEPHVTYYQGKEYQF